MDPDAKGVADLPSHAAHYWKKCIAEKEMKCWGSSATIKVGDEYYEYILELTLYGLSIDTPKPVVTKKVYFKQVLQGRPGFNYDQERRERDEK